VQRECSLLLTRLQRCFATVLCGVIDTGRRKMVLGDAAVERLELRNVSPIVRQVIEKTGLGGILVVTQ
jgi:anti-anti-sigma regulatory factor